MSTESQILEKIKNYKRWNIFFPIDFRLLGFETAVRQSLDSLDKRNKLVYL